MCSNLRRFQAAKRDFAHPVQESHALFPVVQQAQPHAREHVHAAAAGAKPNRQLRRLV